VKVAACLVLLSIGALTSPAHAFPLDAQDVRNDGGSRINLSWTAPPKPPPEWIVYRSEPGKPFAPIDTVGGALTGYSDDNRVKDGIPYRYRLLSLPEDATLSSDVSPVAVAQASWFDTAKLNVFVVIAIFLALVLFYIRQAERGKVWSFRSIAGLTAIEEAIGRSTEMGKGVLYIPGVQDIDDIQTIASMIILGNVARMTAKYETPNRCRPHERLETRPARCTCATLGHSRTRCPGRVCPDRSPPEWDPCQEPGAGRSPPARPP